MEEAETAEELLAKQHRKEKKDLQGGILLHSAHLFWFVFICLLFTVADLLYELKMGCFEHCSSR